MNKTWGFSILGAILGVPLSYYFQPDAVQAKLTLPKYIQELPEIMKSENPDIIAPVVLSVFLCTLIFGIIGYFMDKNTNRAPEAAS